MTNVTVVFHGIQVGPEPMHYKCLNHEGTFEQTKEFYAAAMRDPKFSTFVFNTPGSSVIINKQHVALIQVEEAS